MCTYLLPTRTGYYFRRAIPAKLRPFLGGKREFKYTLNTKDRDAAKRLIPDHTKKTQALLDQAQAALAIATAPPPPAVRPKSLAQLGRERAEWDFEQEQLAHQTDDEDRRFFEAQELAPIIDALAVGKVYEAPPAIITRAAHLAVIEEREIARIDREHVEFREAQANERLAKYAVSDPVAPAVPISDGKGLYLDTNILDGWATERAPSASGRAAYASSANLFNSTMGRKSVELITKTDIMAYKRHLIADPDRSQINVRNHLAYVRTLLAWAAQNDLIDANPAKEVRMWVTQKGEKRKDFDIDDLTALMNGPVHAEGKRPKGCGGEAAYWLPLLALFMGARREELGQLRVSDVRMAPYVDADNNRKQAWCIDITDAPDEADALPNQVKNAGSRRLIPLHPKLIELGFIRYVQGLANQQGRVFPDLKPTGVGQKLTDKWGQWFGQYKRDLGITDRTKVFHSFRHTWKTHAGNAGIAERISREFQGHEGKDAADKYGAAPSMATMVAAIAKYQVPGLEISSP